MMVFSWLFQLSSSAPLPAVGVFENARLLVTVERELRASGLVPLRPLQLGPNDGAVSYGQAAVAAARLAAGTA